MSEWIESHANLREHPKLKRLARCLSVSRREATGLLHWLWWWATAYAPDGDLAEFSDEDIADGLDWEGDASHLVSSLRDCGFLDGSVIHDWDQYGGKLQYRRRANAERMREARSKSETDISSTRATHVQRTCNARAQHVSSERTGQDRTGHTEKRESSVVAAARAREDATSSASRDASAGEEPPPRANGWTARWVDALRAAGRPEPAKADRAVFGRKCKEIADLEPTLMLDAIRLMVERDKPPGVLVHVYGDAKRIADEELLKVATGGRPRVR